MLCCRRSAQVSSVDWRRRRRMFCMEQQTKFFWRKSNNIRYRLIPYLPSTFHDYNYMFYCWAQAPRLSTIVGDHKNTVFLKYPCHNSSMVPLLEYKSVSRTHKLRYIGYPVFEHSAILLYSNFTDLLFLLIFGREHRRVIELPLSL